MDFVDVEALLVGSILQIEPYVSNCRISHGLVPGTSDMQNVPVQSCRLNHTFRIVA